MDAQFEDVDFYKVDVDEQEEIAAEWDLCILYLSWDIFLGLPKNWRAGGSGEVVGELKSES